MTALLFTIGKLLIGLYLGKSSVALGLRRGGLAGGLLLWVYYSSQILFLGAEFTQVYAQPLRLADPAQQARRAGGAEEGGGERPRVAAGQGKGGRRSAPQESRQ